VKAVLIGLTLALTASATLAQENGGPDLVDALVVNARTPGPAWWSVSKGEAKVWVLGVGVPVEASARWEDAAFRRRVKAARRVILVPASTTKFSNEALKADRAWMDELTDAERARLAEIAGTTGRKVAFYAAFRPNFAGLLIKSDLDARAKPRPGKAMDLKAKARALGATLVPVSGQEAQSMKNSFTPGGRDGLTCLRWAMRPRDPTASREQRARAWTRGDVRDLLLGPTAYDPCIQAMGAMQAMMENNESLMTEAIAASLDGGQGAVAFVTLTPLLRQGGVLDQLRKRGYAIETPAQLADED
jgi:hypothetical protein